MSRSGAPARAAAMLVAALSLSIATAAMGARGQMATADRIKDPGWWPTKGTAARSEYAGTAACRDCHPRESASQPSTSMARKAARADRSDVLRASPRLTFDNAGYAYAIASDGPQPLYGVTQNERSSSAPLTWAFGDGKVGQSYLFERDGAFYGAPVSYYQSVHGLGFTPGRALAAPRSIDEAMGRRLDDTELRRCFACHTTAPIAAGKFDASTAVPGITCEGCHGPGRRHAEVMTQPRHVAGDAPMLNPANLTAEEALDFCGACHGSFFDFVLAGHTGIAALRPQPYAPRARGPRGHAVRALAAPRPAAQPLLAERGRAARVHRVPRSAPLAGEGSGCVRRSLQELSRLRGRAAVRRPPGTGVSCWDRGLSRLPHAEIRSLRHEAPLHRSSHARRRARGEEARGSGPAVGVADADERADDRFAGNALDDGTDDGGQAEGDIAAEGQRLELDDHTAGDFLVPPVGIEAPQEPAVIAWRPLALLGSADAVHFGDLRGHATARHAMRTGTPVRDVFFGVVGHGQPSRSRHPDEERQAVGPALQHAQREHILGEGSAFGRM